MRESLLTWPRLHLSTMRGEWLGFIAAPPKSTDEFPCLMGFIRLAENHLLEKV
jgi:hypothetical protein